MARGLTTEAQAEAFKKRVREEKRAAIAEGIRKAIREKNAVTWDRLFRSVEIAKKVIQAYPYKSDAEHEWAHEMEQLLADAVAAINERKYEENMPATYFFWYDVTRSINERLSALIETFPRGSECSPITKI